MNTKTLAFCVPTIGHADVIQDVLSKCIHDYHEYGIDIYYYDSGETDETRKVIEYFNDRGYDNLYYIKVDASYSLSEKLEMIYSGVGLKKEYDYIWPAKDRSFSLAATLDGIMAAMEEEHDFIMLASNFEAELTSVYEDAADFYKDWAWLATSLDSIIYKSSTVLNKYDSAKFNVLYGGEYLRSYRAYEYVFSKMAELQEADSISIKALTGPDIAIYNSELGKSMWDKRTFIIWKDYWIVANEKLPECYSEYKSYVIKKTASLPWIMGTVDRLVKLHDMGVLVPEALDSIEHNWERVSDLPVRKLREIAYGNYDIYHDLDNFSKGKDEIADILIEMSGLLKDGRMSKADFPANDVLSCIMSKYNAGKYANSREKLVFIGSVKDILTYILKADTDIDNMCKGIQMLINYVTLL